MKFKNNNNNSNKSYFLDNHQEDIPKSTLGMTSLGMIIFSIILGFIIGLIIWIIFNLSISLTELVWNFTSSTINFPWISLILCPIGGICIGLCTKYFGGEIKNIHEIMETVKENGTYSLKNPLASILNFIFPIIFGGSIGPEAGLTGFIVAGCSKFNHILKKAGLRIMNLTEITASAALSAIFVTPLIGIVSSTQNTFYEDFNQDFRKKSKLILYTAAAFGSILAIITVNSIFSSNFGIPHFDGVTPSLIELKWIIPCFILAYSGGFLYHVSDKFFSKLSIHFKDYTLIKPVMVGIVLGALAIKFPLILFSGESQSFMLMKNWQSISFLILIITGLLKCFITPMCINLGWKGGHFFPCIFSGIALGYGIAGISGIDPMFCVAITTSTLMASIQRKALITIALLLLCFPLKSIAWVGIACLIGANLPMPKFLNRS